MEDTVQLTPEMKRWFNLGYEQVAGGHWPQAETIYRRILAEWPESPDALCNLATTLKFQRRQGEAVGFFNRAIELRPNFPQALNNLGSSLLELGRPAEAIEVLRRALVTSQEFSLVWNNLAMAMKDTGDLDGAISCLDRSIQLQPMDMTAASSRVYTLHFHSRYDAGAICREARAWNDRFAKPLAGESHPFDNDPAAERRLRIGYISPDFRNHCLSLFNMPLFSRHNHEAFEIYCYNTAGDSDAVTARLRRHADVWRDVAGMTDLQLAGQIRQDKIDILVEISLHMTNHRLFVLARRPAPIQVTWLGYPGTTGLDAIDYRISDPRLDPPPPGRLDAEGRDMRDGRLGLREDHYSERTVHLPDTFWCYDPYGAAPSDDFKLPEVGPLPALAAGRITFGCLNNYCKVTDATLELWAEVLAAVPGSELVLLSLPGPHRERVVRKLGLEDGTRVRFVPPRSRHDYLATYREIDLCLDTIPYNGHTTSLDAMWMGVAVVTLTGRTVVGRGGWSQLHNLGLLELVARSEAEFVQKAVDWAGNRDRLAALRANLRQRMERSPLMDGARFAQNMEIAYRRMWRAWCGARR